MEIERYELTDGQWERIAPLLPGQPGHVGWPAGDNRLFVIAVLWVMRSGARWCDVPERYGKHRSIHSRFMKWSRPGWDRLFAALPRAIETTKPC